VFETSTSPGSAQDITRAPMWTAMPPMSPLRRSHSPVWMPARMLIHTGECERRNGDIGGIAVHIGARVMSWAEPGEVLVSNTVKDLTVGSDIEFEERGEHELKGVPGSWRLYAAR